MGTGLGTSPAPMATPQPGNVVQLAALKEVCGRFAGWIGIVGVLTVVNSAGAALGLNWNFFVGLGITTMVDVVAKKGAGTAGSVMAVAVAVIAGAVFGVLWNFARQGATWAFAVAGVLYALDTAMYVLMALAVGALWLSVLLHGLALYYIFRGVGAAKRFSALRAAQAAAVPGVISSSAQ